MAELNGTSQNKDRTLRGQLSPIDDAVSNESAALPLPLARAWPPGAQAARKEGQRAKYIIGPSGDVITVADLPVPGTLRWVIRRKAEVVLAVHAGLISLEEACRRYRLTVEEFFSWQTAIERHGLLALRTTQLQQYRHGEGELDSATGRQAPRRSAADRFVFTADDVA